MKSRIFRSSLLVSGIALIPGFFAAVVIFAICSGKGSGEVILPLILAWILIFALCAAVSAKTANEIVSPLEKLNPEQPEDGDIYRELVPVLKALVKQKRTIGRQLAQAKKRQEEFRLITEYMQEGLLVVDAQMELLSCNNAALKLLEAEKNEGNILELNRSVSFRRVVTDMLEGKSASGEMEQGQRTYKLIANPVAEKGRVIGGVVIILDITESVRREILRREFTANVSHELKTPLTSISGFAELMMYGGTSEEAVKDFSATIYDEAQRLITLVSDIIKISELDENSTQIGFEPVDLYKVAGETVKILEKAAQKRNISIEIKGMPAVVSGSPTIIGEMVYNLCDNAVKYNRENGRVEIMVMADGGTASIQVRDTGIGIPAEFQSRVFERFFRVDKSRSKAEGGTGLGLSIVKHGAMYHGAELDLESTPGEGTAVKISFK